MKLWKKLIEFVNYVDRVLIFKAFKWTGLVLASPVFIINAFFRKPPLTFIPFEEDFEDFHTFRHFAISSILTALAYGLLKLNPTASFYFAFLIMYAYEILDGLKLIDERGFQMSDLGADFFGAWFIYLFLAIRGGR
jgi:hypothetical protein